MLPGYLIGARSWREMPHTFRLTGAHNLFFGLLVSSLPNVETWNSQLLELNTCSIYHLLGSRNARSTMGLVGNRGLMLMHAETHKPTMSFTVTSASGGGCAEPRLGGVALYHFLSNAGASKIGLFHHNIIRDLHGLW
jgi:hypothetical protein